MESLRTSSAHVLVSSDQLSASGAVVIDADTEHHLRRVLRLRDGESVSVTDGVGRWLLATTVIAGSVMRLEPVSGLVTEPERSRPITIAVAMPKGDRLDWLVQKVTELGVDRIVLLHAQRSVVRWKPERTAAQLERLQRISDEACRQSRRVWRVAIDEPVEATTVLGSFIAAEPGGRDLAPGDRSVAIGPEGGWSVDELDQAAELVSLGPNILRTETAAVAASTLCVTFDR
jgi:16S rRNA (uracil1498-N3)-methyltransferase